MQKCACVLFFSHTHGECFFFKTIFHYDQIIIIFLLFSGKGLKIQTSWMQTSVVWYFSCLEVCLDLQSLLIPSHCTCKKSVEWMKLWHLVKSNYNPHRRFRHPHRISSSVTYKVLKQYIFCFCLVLNIFTIEGFFVCLFLIFILFFFLEFWLEASTANFDNRQMKWKE